MLQTEDISPYRPYEQFSSHLSLPLQPAYFPQRSESPTDTHHLSAMPLKNAQDSSAMPEAQGLRYNESKMALFHARLAYDSTVDERKASQDPNLVSISEAQAKILKRWDLLQQAEEELAAQGKSLSPTDKRQLMQYAWRFKHLEQTATKTTGG